MQDTEIIEQIIYSFTNYNLRDIKEINSMKNSELDFTIAEFILCSCFIDQISGFVCSDKAISNRYKKFVKKYLSAYDPDRLYDDLRNKLVHNYSIGNGYYGLTRKAPQLHLKMSNGLVYLNLENFIHDLELALNKCIDELNNDAQIRKHALKWYSTHKILSLVRHT